MNNLNCIIYTIYTLSYLSCNKNFFAYFFYLFFVILYKIFYIKNIYCNDEKITS